MRGVFDDGAPEPVPARRDAEVTLSSSVLLGIFFGLVLLCGLFFGWGYSVGHRGAQPASTAEQPPAAAPAGAQSEDARAKPSASSQANSGQQQSAAVSLPEAVAASTDAAVSPQTADPAAVGAPVNGQPQVRPALPSATASSSQPAVAQTVQPALGPGVASMVQIAAVSDPEDAEVLVNALRKRGFAVSAHRVAADGLIHVQIGPFNNRNEALAMRQRLLNEGYNAMVQP